MSKEHNNYSYGSKCVPDITNSFVEILEKLETFQEMGSLTFLTPFSFAIFDGCYFSCSFVVVYL